MQNFGGSIVQRNFACVTFFNLNNYVMFLCFALPFLFLGAVLYRGQKFRLAWTIAAILVTGVCIMFNSSRGGLITLVLMALIYVFSIGGHRRQNYLYILALLIVGVWLISVRFGSQMLEVLMYRSADGGLLNGESRYVIWGHVLEAVKENYGLGAGLGGGTKLMAMFTTGITAPHNMFLEIMLYFGPLVLLVFVVFLLKIYLRGRKLDDNRRLLVRLFLIPLPVYAIINSTYLLQPHVYVAFACLTAIAWMDRIKPRTITR